MLVKEAEIGNLYRPKSNAVWSEKKGPHIDCPKDVSHVKLWKGHLTKTQQLDNKHPALLYLGPTREKWKLGGTAKHHWFLVDGKRVILSGNSFDLLETLDERKI